jgi:hypothetical protein
MMAIVPRTMAHNRLYPKSAPACVVKTIAEIDKAAERRHVAKRNAQQPANLTGSKRGTTVMVSKLGLQENTFGG